MQKKLITANKKNFNKVKKIILALFLFIFLVIPVLGLATNGVRFANPLAAYTFEELFARLIDILFNVSLALAPLMIVIGTVYFMMPDEKGENIQTGKKIINYTIIGFVIIIAARGMIEVLRAALLH